MAIGRPRKDYTFLINKRLGKLVPVRILKETSKRGQSQIECLCDCGNKKIYRAHHIEEGDLVSCGCWKSGKERMFPTFMKKIEKTDTCWKWKGMILKSGYARHNCKYAHRLSYEYHKGKIPKDKMICHTCNNKACVNPDHMYLGTAYDNAQDAVKCGVLLGRNNRKNK